MRSPDDVRLTGLAEDLETSPEDVRALRRAAGLRPTDPFAAVQRLIDALPPASRPVRRETAAGRPEFVLR